MLRYDGVAGSSWIFEALAGHHEDTSKFSGPGTLIPQYIDRTGSTPYPTAGGFGYHENQENTREVLKADVSKYFGSSLELKVGADREDVKVVTDRFNGGAGQRIYIFNNRVEPGGPLAYRHRYYVDVSAPGFDRSDPSTWVPNEPLHVEPETTNTAAYAQASWKPLSNLTFNAGFRWEVQDIGNSMGRERGEDRRQLLAALPVRLGSAVERPLEAVRLVRPLLRVDPARHQRPRVR